MQYSRLELPAGDDQLVVLLVNEDSAATVDPSGFAQAIADDAAARRAAGWRLVSFSALPLRQSATTMFQGSGQFATQAGLIQFYSAQPSETPAGQNQSAGLNTTQQ